MDFCMNFDAGLIMHPDNQDYVAVECIKFTLLEQLQWLLMIVRFLSGWIGKRKTEKEEEKKKN